MPTFTDMIHFAYTEQDVDKDIKHLLRTGHFKPAYANIASEFLQPEIDNCKKTINDAHHHLTVFKQDTMNEETLHKKPEDINPVLDRLHFEPRQRAFWFNYFVKPVHGRQKEPPLSILQNGGQKEIMYPFGFVTDAFYTVYTEIHELMHAMQGKYFVFEALDKFYKEHYELLYQGKSRDEAIALQTLKNPALKEELHYTRCFMEIQANAAAACYMMLKAVESGDQKIISAVEKRLLNESASMSDALTNENLGLAYFDYPATKQIIEEVKQGKCSSLLDEKGLLNWENLYAYTKTKIDEMGYGKKDMYASLQTAKMLKGIRVKHPGDKEAFLQEVEAQAPRLKHPHNKIFAQFVEAQRSFVYDASKNLHHFYHRLGNQNTRGQLLKDATPQTVKNIEEYRKLYRQNIAANRLGVRSCLSGRSW